MKNDRVFLTEKEAAGMLGISPGTLRNSRCQSAGRLFGRPAPPHFRFGQKCIRYERTILLDWIGQFMQTEKRA